MALSPQVLIVGHTGFIGSALASGLQAEYSIQGMGRQFRPQVSYAQSVLDISSRPLLKQAFEKGTPQHVIFALGGTHPRLSITNPQADLDIQIRPLLALLESLPPQSIESFVYLSSVAVYGNPDTELVQETSKVQPLSPYGFHKALAEQYVEYYADQKHFLPIIIRPVMIYGPGQRTGVLKSFGERIQNQKPALITGDGYQRFQYLYISDVVEAIKSLLQKPQAGTYNLAGDQHPSVLELYHYLAQCAGQEPLVEFVPSNQAEIKRLVVEDRLFQDRFDWKPQIDWQTGVERYWNWLCNR